MSDAIFIAGYYRSGTSALAGALQRLGVTLHNDAEPNEHNPRGFYEIPELIEFDVALFNQLGVEWTDLRGLPERWWDRADMAGPLAKLDEILRRRFATEPLWALKHPHLCRLFPIYERAAVQAGHRMHAIHITRDPWTVASSQYRKNNLSRAHAVLLWVDYLISAERHARHLTRCWLTYHDLLSNPAVQFRKIEQDLNIALCKRLPAGLLEAGASLTGKLNRAQPTADKDLFTPLRNLAVDIWEAVQSHDDSIATWNRFSKARAEVVGFVNEISESGARALPGFGHHFIQQGAVKQNNVLLRPPERLDDGARRRLLALRDARPKLPGVTVLIAAPPNRAHAITETLQSLQAQWHLPDVIKIISVDPAEIMGEVTVRAASAAGAITEILCAELNVAATDYAALINAGDTLAPDACLRFALEAATSHADMIYCDEVVPRDNGTWVRYKPGWDATRLRQAAYIGDWVWYSTCALTKIGGFNPAFSGVEEYDVQLRLAEVAAHVVRLPETLFTRATHSRRDNIPSTVFGARAIEAISQHLQRMNMPALVQPRRHFGLFHHEREAPDPGTSIIILCDGADVAMLDRWLTELLSDGVLTGPVVLTGTVMPPQTVQYLAEVVAREAVLEGKVLAVAPMPGVNSAAALRKAIELCSTEFVAIIEARATAATPDWRASLRARLADPSAAMVGARALVALARDTGRFSVQGPIILGADTRLGAGHLADDPGPGGWLAVDQEASGVSPPCVMARRAILAACQFNNLAGDALWIDICAQIRISGQRIIWTPDVGFILQGNSIRPDYEGNFRDGSPAARDLPWADAYHHPALSLRGDLLAAEQRLGLVRAAPADQKSLLLSGPAESGMALLNAARAMRASGAVEANWVGDHLLAGEIGRRAPSPWVRINPQAEAPAHSLPYCAVYTAAPVAAAKPAITAAQTLYATSPALVAKLRKLTPPGRAIELWRPALSGPVWEALPSINGLNTLPRVLWIDEGIAPTWWPDFINQTQNTLSWIVVERGGQTYAGAVTTLVPPPDEQSWARELGNLAPHIYVRPADSDADADHYHTIMAAAAGCLLLVDERFDTPDSLNAVKLSNRIAAWQRAVQKAASQLDETLEQGTQTRQAALALPTIEAEPPAWLTAFDAKAMIRAAE
ncbi:MAG: hypothetical protein POG74_06420 [Acidocella sp.]|nr:hypothetical protein [Acidocella sp.]